MNLMCFMGGDTEKIKKSLEKHLIDKYEPDLYITCKVPSGPYQKKGTKIEEYNADFSGKPEYEGHLLYEAQIPLDPWIINAFMPYYSDALATIERSHSVLPIPLVDLNLWVYEHLTYWNTILTKYPMDFAIWGWVPHVGFDYLLYALCKIHNIPTIFLSYTFVPNYWHIAQETNNPGELIEQTYHELLKGYDSVSIDKIVLKKDFSKEFDKLISVHEKPTPSYMKEFSATETKPTPFLLKCFRWLKEFFLHGNGKKVRDERAFWKQTHIYNQKWELLSKAPDYSKKYIYVPLHFQPECTTLPLGSYFREQLLILRILSAAIPDDMLLYVKENPIQNIRGRSTDYPQKLSKIPKVVLVSQNEDTYQLIDNAMVVAACTGTALLECVFRGIPGLAFGNIYTTCASGVLKVDSVESCKNALDELEKNQYKADPKKLKLFAQAVETHSFDIDSDDDMIDIVQAIDDIMGKTLSKG